MLNTGLFLLTAFLGIASAAGVTGAAEGFAKGVTGGGSASPVYPSTTAELVSCRYMGSLLPLLLNFSLSKSHIFIILGSGLVH